MTREGRLIYRAAGQPRVPQESHLRKLLTAAHTYSRNGSRITSCSSGRGRHDCDRHRQPIGLAQPSRGSFEGDCRRTLGSDSRRDWEVDLSFGRPDREIGRPRPLLPAAGLFPPATPCRELGPPDPHLRAVARHPLSRASDTGNIRRVLAKGRVGDGIFFRRC